MYIYFKQVCTLYIFTCTYKKYAWYCNFSISQIEKNSSTCPGIICVCYSRKTACTNVLNAYSNIEHELFFIPLTSKSIQLSEKCISD